MDNQWLLDSGSYLGIILFLILTGAGMPLPEEVAIVFAGIRAAQGSLDPGLALGACLIGALVGDCVMYAIGYRLGLSWLRHHPLVARVLHVEREKQMERLIATHGIKIFFLARFMVGVRGPIYLSAGVLKVPFRRFLAIDAVCATIVVGLFYSLSFFFGRRVIKWIQRGEIGLTITVVTALVVAGVWFYIRHRRKFKKLAAETADCNTADAVQPPDEDDQGESSEEKTVV